MFNNNNNPDYYNDAVRDARVNYENIDNQSNSKGKLLLILNLFLISAILGYFIYQNLKIEQKTAVKGVNYTVDIREDEVGDDDINNDTIALPVETKHTTSRLKKTSELENLIDNSVEESSDYVKALDKELKETDSKKVETPHKNRDLENILANMDVKEFSETSNMVKVNNDESAELDVNELADVINAIVSEELSDNQSF